MKVLLLAAVAILFSTGGYSQTVGENGVMLLSGTMQHTTLEGGCWYLDANNGKHYEIVGDAGMIASLETEGKLVQLRVKPKKGMASTCMIGPIVEVIEDVTPRLHPTDLVTATVEIEGTMHYTGKKWYVKTRNGARYEFETLPAKRYRKIGRHYKHTDRVLINPSERHVSGHILGAPVLPSSTKAPNVQKPQPSAR